MALALDDPAMSALLGALVGGAAATLGGYLAMRHRTASAERARMATEIMYHVMTGLVLLEEALASVEEVLLERDKGGGGKGPRDAAEHLRKELDAAFAGYDPLRPHIDYRVGKVMRLPAPAMKMLDDIEHRLTEAFDLWDGGRLLQAAAKGDDDRVARFDELVKRSSEDVSRFAAVLRRV
jgi:hypothetical protein